MTLELIVLYILSSFVFAVAHGFERFGWVRTLLLLGLAFSISLLFESAGVLSGLVYGSYSYTNSLGPMFAGLVPYIIPVAWFVIMYPSLIIALRVVPECCNRIYWVVLVAGVGALVMTAMDLALDPIMVSFGYWVWEPDGTYFGVPLLNYLSWWVTTFIVFCAFLLLGRIKRPESIQASTTFNRLPVISYAITGLSTVLVASGLELDGAALVGFIGMLPWVIMGWWGND